MSAKASVHQTAWRPAKVKAAQIRADAMKSGPVKSTRLNDGGALDDGLLVLLLLC